MAEDNPLTFSLTVLLVGWVQLGGFPWAPHALHTGSGAGVVAGASVIRGFSALSVPDGFTYMPGTQASCCMTSLFLHGQGMDFKRREIQVSRPFKDCSQNWHSVSSAVRAVPGLAEIHGAREMQCLLVGMCQGSLPRHVWEGRV